MEIRAFRKLNNLIGSRRINYSVIIEDKFSVIKKDGTTEEIDTGQNGSQGDAAVYPSATQNGEGILGLNPNPENIQVNVIDVVYDDGNQKPKNLGDVLLNNGRGPIRAYSIYENFWHAVGHLNGGSNNQGAAMEVENLGGAIRKIPFRGNSFTSFKGNGLTSYIPASIERKEYNTDHPKE